MKIQTGALKMCELHSSLRCLIRPYRWAGFFPVEGLDQLDPRRIRYTLKSPYAIYYIASIIGHIFITSTSLFWFLDKNMTLAGFSNILFYGSVLTVVILSIKLAKNWPKLTAKATKIEESLKEIRTTKNISTKCSAVAYFLMLLGLVEHLLSKLFQVKHLMLCSGETTFNRNVIRMYLQRKNIYIFDYIAYNPIIGVLGELVSLQATFIWNFVDAMMMLISIYITSYFSDLNKALISYQNKEKIPWSRIRLYHSRVVILLKQIDAQLKAFLTASLFSNLFFLCFQLFNSLHWTSYGSAYCDPTSKDPEQPSAEYVTYYIFSFSYLALRTAALSILVANVHLVAQGPLLPLYEVPTSDYNIEVQRFQLGLRYTTIGLSGLFFHVTRKTIPRVIGTVITYELVLLEFSRNVTEHQLPAFLEKH